MTDKPQPSRDERPAAVRRMAHCRKQIDALDERLVALLNERAAHALEIGRLKELTDMEVYQPQREVVVLEQAQSASRGPLDSGAISRIFERIIDENRRMERVLKDKQARERQ